MNKSEKFWDKIARKYSKEDIKDKERCQMMLVGKKEFGVLIFVVAFMLIAPSNGFGSCTGSLTLKEEIVVEKVYHDADLVFYGKVVRIDFEYKDAARIVFKPIKFFRGNREHGILVSHKACYHLLEGVENWAEGYCTPGATFEIGKEYLVYTSERDGRLRIDSCSRTFLLEYDFDLRILERISNDDEWKFDTEKFKEVEEYYLSGNMICRGKTGGGLEKKYYADGSLNAIFRCVDGKLDGVKKSYMRGHLNKEVNYKLGKRDGVQKSYYYDSDGLLMMKSFYKDNVQEGEFKYFFIDGALQMLANYENGQVQGEAIEYYQNGKVKVVELYEKGELLSRKEFDGDGNLTSEKQVSE